MLAARFIGYTRETKRTLLSSWGTTKNGDMSILRKPNPLYNWDTREKPHETKVLSSPYTPYLTEAEELNSFIIAGGSAKYLIPLSAEKVYTVITNLDL